MRIGGPALRDAVTPAGEVFQNGFVDACDTPCTENIAGIREVGCKLYELRRAP